LCKIEVQIRYDNFTYQNEEEIMTNNPVTTVKNLWRINRLGAGMFIMGAVLCITSVILSTIWRLDFASISDNEVYVVTMIEIGVPFILAGIGILLRPQKLPTCMMPEDTIENYTIGTVGNYVQGTVGSYVQGTDGSYVQGTDGNCVQGTDGNCVQGTDGNYIKDANGNYIKDTNGNYDEWTDKNFVGNSGILIIELVASLVLAILLFASYPNGWNYPNFYILILLYATCLLLLTVGVLSNMSEKETDISYMRKEIECSNMIIEEREEMCKDNSAPDYTTDFAKKLNGNIDDLKIIMDELKISIDIGAKGIAERTATVANKYRSDNEKLHNDLQGFKQRTEKEKIESKERANERVIKSLMSTLYSIDELSKYRDKDANYTVGDIGKIKEDIYNIIKNESVDIINPSIGDNFDDKKCCAVKTIETDKFPGNKIVDIKKIGCMFKSGKVINYADVVVSKSDIKVEDNTEVDAKVDTKLDTKANIKNQVEANKVDTKLDTKANIKNQVEANKVDTKLDTKANIKTQVEANKANIKTQVEANKANIKTQVEANKNVIQDIIEYIKNKIFGKTDNDEQNKKDENNKGYIMPNIKKKDENNKGYIMPNIKKKDENNKGYIMPNIKKKGD